MNFKWCVGHEVVLAWILFMKNFFSQRIPGFFLFVFFCSYIGFFLLITDKMHAYQKQI